MGIAVICLLWLLWMYAFITGLSPSVLRAVFVFISFVAVARFGRNTNIYNTLAASAFILLLYDPLAHIVSRFSIVFTAVWNRIPAATASTIFGLHECGVCIGHSLITMFQ